MPEPHPRPPRIRGLRIAAPEPLAGRLAPIASADRADLRASPPEPRAPAIVAPDGPGLRLVLALAPLAAVGVGLAGIGLRVISEPVEVVTAVILPLAILAAIALGERPGPRLAAAALIDLEAILAGAVNPAGMAFAVVLPLIAVGLALPIVRGRPLAILFLASALSAVAGVAAAVSIGPDRTILPPGGAPLSVLAFGAVTTFALGLHWRTTRHLSATLTAAEKEIAERIATERRLRETSAILSAILTSSPVATQAFGRDGKVILWNPASERTFGWSADELVGKPLPAAMVPADDREPSQARIERTFSGGTVNGERVRRLTKDGAERWIDIYAAPLLGPDGEAIGIAGQLVDVTERVRMEAELAQAQKMGAVGLLASGIAHDFNNTLTAAGGYAELIRTETTGSIRADADALIDVVERGRDLTRRLLDFARRSEGAPSEVDLRDVVIGLEPLLRRLIGSTIAIELRLAAEPMRARVQVGQLEQALINLAINARDAMPDGGRLRIGLTPADGDATGHGITSGRVVLIVEDTGVGIPPTVVSSIFEPFFTTKPIRAGTGLGLAMVRGFVETAGGAIGVRSEPGQGTRFTIELPRLGASQRS